MQDKSSSSEYFRTIDRSDIKNIICILKNKLPNKCTNTNYQLTIKQFNITHKRDLSLQDSLKLVADAMRKHLNLNEPIKILTSHHVEAGRFEIIDDLNCIYVNDNMITQNMNQKIAILAHEMSHYFLIRKHNIINPNENENEFLTEINAIYTGFGLLLQKGYAVYVKQVGGESIRTKIGYISLDNIREAIIQTAYARKQRPQWIIENSNFEDKFYYTFRLFGLLIKYANSRFGHFRKSS